MVRFLGILILCLCVIWPCTGFGAAGQDSKSFYIKIVVNGKTLKENGICHKGFAYVPLRAVAESMGAPYESDPSKKSASFNSKPIKGTALKQGGVFYIPAMAIAENTGAKVRFDIKNKTVSISGGKFAVATNTPPPTPDATPPPESFIPVKAENDVFRVTVTNIEAVSSMKGHYKPQQGNKYVIIYLSQQNISDEVQIYTGKLALIDSNGQAHDYIEALSNFWLLVLRPGGINFGYLVFEVPQNAVPMKVVLSTTTRPPLTLNLK